MGEHVSLTRPATRAVTEIPECTCQPGVRRTNKFGGAVMAPNRNDTAARPVLDPNCPRHRSTRIVGMYGPGACHQK